MNPFTLIGNPYFLLSSSYHPFKNPRVNPIADILPVNGIPKPVTAIEAVATAYSSILSGIYIVRFESVVIVCSDTT